jgi:hypothetical protein
MIAVRQQFDDRGEARAAVSFVHDLVWFKPVFPRPVGPDTRYRGRRINEHAIHIEEYGITLNQSHRRSCFPSFKRQHEGF